MAQQKNWTSGPLCIYVSGVDRELIHQTAARYGVSVSDLVRQAVRREAEHPQIVQGEQPHAPANARTDSG